MRQWIPNATYGAHAFRLNVKEFETFLAQRVPQKDQGSQCVVGLKSQFHGYLL